MNLVKIGYSSNFDKHSEKLRCDYGEFEIISLNNYEDAYAEELLLHKKFDCYNVVLSEGTGETEWFHPKILELL